MPQSSENYYNGCSVMEVSVPVRPYSYGDVTELYNVFNILPNTLGTILTLIFGILFLPLKLIFLIPILLGYTIFVHIIYFLSPVGSFLEMIFRSVTRITAFLICLFAGYIYVPSKGKPNSESRIIVSNHVSELEILFTYILFAPSYVSAEFVLRNPVCRAFATANHMIGVDRQKNKNYDTFKAKLEDRVKDRCKPPVLIFPEGTTSNGTHVTHFQSGAFSAGAPVQPLVIVFDKFPVDDSWSLQHFLLVLLRQFCRPFARAHVKCLPLYHPSPAEIEHPAYYAWNIQHLIARAGGFGISHLTYREKHTYEILLAKNPSMFKGETPGEDIRPYLPHNSHDPEALISNTSDDEMFNEYTFYIPPGALDCTQSDFYSTAVLPPPEILEFIENSRHTWSSTLDPQTQPLSALSSSPALTDSSVSSSFSSSSAPHSILASYFSYVAHPPPPSMAHWSPYATPSTDSPESCSTL